MSKVWGQLLSSCSCERHSLRRRRTFLLNLAVYQLNWTFSRPLSQCNCPLQGCRHVPASASRSPTLPGRQEKLSTGLVSLWCSPSSVFFRVVPRADGLQCHSFGDCSLHGNGTSFCVLALRKLHHETWLREYAYLKAWMCSTKAMHKENNKKN